ncbi:MAG TPA: hypothetical protein VGJ13_01445 [Pseudonocardiaceae bacterium]
MAGEPADVVVDVAVLVRVERDEIGQLIAELGCELLSGQSGRAGISTMTLPPVEVLQRSTWVLRPYKTGSRRSGCSVRYRARAVRTSSTEPSSAFDPRSVLMWWPLSFHTDGSAQSVSFSRFSTAM